jgi:hypothetical protein
LTSEHNKQKAATGFYQELQHKAALSKNGSKNVDNNQKLRKKFVPVFFIV